MNKSIPEAVLESVARAICMACEENPDHQGDARGNEFRWQDYRDAALAAISAFTAAQKPAEYGCHCGTCTCNPNMTPAVRFDLSPAQMEGAIRDHLIRLGWTPPDEPAVSQQPEERGGGAAEPPSTHVGVDFAAVASILRRAMRDGAHYGYRRDFILQQALALGALSHQPAAVDDAMVERACRHWYAQWDKADQATQRVWAKTMYDLLTAALATKHQGDRR